MDWNAFGAATSGIGGLFSSIGNIAAQAMANKANMQAVRENNALQRELSEYQWSKNLEMWNLQNQYNSPASQMARFMAAGLNPNLIYSQGNAGNASSMPSYQSPTTQAVTRNAIKIGQFDQALDLIGKYLNIKIGAQQLQNMESQRNLLEMDRLIKFERNMRDWQLHPHNLDLKKAIYQSTRRTAEKLAWESGIKKHEYNWWEKHGYAPNLGWQQALFGKIQSFPRWLINAFNKVRDDLTGTKSMPIEQMPGYIPFNF